MVNTYEEKLALLENSNLWNKTKNQIDILGNLGQPGGFRFSELEERVDMSRKTLSKHLKKLEENGFIKKENERYHTTVDGTNELSRKKSLINLGTASVRDLTPFSSKNQLGEKTVETTGTISPFTTSGGKIEIENPEQLVEKDSEGLRIIVPEETLKESEGGTVALTWEKEKESG